METHIITIKPPLQIVDIGNGCEAYSASIYILAKSELMATLQSVTRSQFFLEYNFNYTNVSNFLVWYKLDFAKLMNKEIETLKAKVLNYLPCLWKHLIMSLRILMRTTHFHYLPNSFWLYWYQWAYVLSP